MNPDHDGSAKTFMKGKQERQGVKQSCEEKHYMEIPITC